MLRKSGIMASREWEGAEGAASRLSAHLLPCRQGHVTVSPVKDDDDDNNTNTNLAGGMTVSI